MIPIRLPILWWMRGCLIFVFLMTLRYFQAFRALMDSTGKEAVGRKINRILDKLFERANNQERKGGEK
jgi:hypothetical protein